MALVPEKFRNLALNVALLFVGTVVSTALALIQTTPKDDLKAFAIAVVTGALVAGVRAVVGFLGLTTAVPAVPVDK